MKHTIEGYIIFQQYNWEEKPEYAFSMSGHVTCTEHCNRAVVMEHSFEVEVPDDFDPRPGFVDQLQQEKERLRAEFSKKVMEIDEKINSLLALEA